jgi:hypothetical protein
MMTRIHNYLLITGYLTTLASVQAIDPPRLLTDRVDQAAPADAVAAFDRIAKKYGGSYSYELDEELKAVIGCSTDEVTRGELRKHLRKHAQDLRKQLFSNDLKHYLSVIIPEKWKGDVVTGHFYPPAYVDARNMGSSLRHEFTHALHFGDQNARNQAHPIWIVEGLASLYEFSRVENEEITPMHSYQLAPLKTIVEEGKYLPFAQLMRLGHRQFTSRHYGQARYIMMYLHESGKLKRFYSAYVKSFERDSTGIAALEEVLDSPLPAIESAWKDWIMSLPSLNRAVSPNLAALGVVLQQAADGILIDNVLPNGLAEKAGIQITDRLSSVDGQWLWEIPDLIDALNERSGQDFVVLRCRRKDEYKEFKIDLGGIPESKERINPHTCVTK